MAKKKTSAKPAAAKPPRKKSANKATTTNTKTKKAATKKTKKTKKKPTKKPAVKSTAKKLAPKKASKKKPAPPAPTKTKPTKRSAARRKESTVKTAKAKPTESKPVKKTKKPTATKAIEKNPPVEKSVEGYLSTLNGWRKDAVASLRTMIQKAAPESSEKVEKSQPVYEHHGPFAWIKAHTKHVHLGFWRGVELPDPRKLLQGTGDKMRHIKLSSLKDAGKKELRELVRIAAKLNEIKGSPTRPAKGKAKHK